MSSTKDLTTLIHYRWNIRWQIVNTKHTLKLHTTPCTVNIHWTHNYSHTFLYKKIKYLIVYTHHTNLVSKLPWKAVIGIVVSGDRVLLLFIIQTLQWPVIKVFSSMCCSLIVFVRWVPSMLDTKWVIGLPVQNGFRASVTIHRP